MKTTIVVVDGANGLTPDMLRKRKPDDVARQRFAEIERITTRYIWQDSMHE